MNVAALHRQVIGERENVIIPRLYLELFDGDYLTAAVFKEIVYWSGDWADTEHQDGWFYRTYDEWDAREHISRAQLNRAIARINDAIPAGEDGVPLVEVATRKIRNRDGSLRNETAKHYRLNPDLYAGLIERGVHSRTVRKLQSGTDTNSHSGSATNSQSPTYTPETAPETAPSPTPRRKPLRALPADFTVTDAMRAWAHEKLPGITDAWLEAQTEEFMIWCAREDARYRDWRAAWQKSMRTKHERGIGLTRPASHPAAPAPEQDTDEYWFGKYAKGGRA